MFRLMLSVVLALTVFAGGSILAADKPVKGTITKVEKDKDNIVLVVNIAAKKKEIGELERSIKNLEIDKAALVTKYSRDKQRFREIAAAGGAGKRLGNSTEKDKIPTWVEVNSEVVQSCLKNWQDTLGGEAYAVFAEIKRDGQLADLVLETRARKKTGEFANVKATCPMRSDGSFDQDGIRAKRALYVTGKG